MSGGRVWQQRQHRGREYDRSPNAAGAQLGAYRETLNLASDWAGSAPLVRRRSGAGPSFQDR